MRLFGAQRSRVAGAAGGEIIAPPHFHGAPRRSRSTRPSPGMVLQNRGATPALLPGTINYRNLSEVSDQYGACRRQCALI